MAYRRTAQVQARLDEQRRSVVRAATELLADSGYAGCSIGRVAERAGIAPGTLYNHFAGKTELLAEVFASVAGHEVQAVRAAVAVPGPAVDRVSAVVETFAGRALKAPRLAYTLLVEPVDPAVQALRLTFRRQFVDIVSAAIADGIRAGELPPQDALVTATAIVGAIAAVLADPLAGPPASTAPADPPNPDVTIDSLITVVRRATGATP